MDLRPSVLLLALLLAPLAAAATDGDGLVLSVDAFPGPVQPLMSTVVADWTAHIDCTLLGDGNTTRASQLNLSVMDVPTWATVLVSPVTAAVSPADCLDGFAQVNGTLTAAADATAPAQRPAMFFVAANLSHDSNHTVTRAAVQLAASPFLIVDVTVKEASQYVTPGTWVPYEIKLSNLGNTRTRVRIEVSEMSDGVTVLQPPTVILGSKQLGETDTTKTIKIMVRAPRDGIFTNEVGTATLRFMSEPVIGSAPAAEESTITLLVTGKGFDLPGPGTGAIAALVVGVALLLRRR